MFETSGIVDVQILKELKNFVLSKNEKLLYVLSFISFIVLSIISFIIDDYFLAYIFIIVSIFPIVMYFLVINIFYNVNVQRINESINNNEINYKVAFDDNGVIINNLTTGNVNHIKYNAIIRKVEMSSSFVFFTKGRQYFFVFKDSLGSTQKDQFIIFIKQRCGF